MMHTVNGGMVHQVSKAHGVLRAVPNREFHNAVEILVPQVCQERPHANLDLFPFVQE
jgi:hypothetical protein